MKYSDLKSLLDIKQVIKPENHGFDDWETSDIPSIHYRSQDVRPQSLFVAVKGLRADGHNYIDDAVQRGAAVIVAQKAEKRSVRQAVTLIVENTRQALGMIAAQFYNHPGDAMCVIGITGTNGKTTTACLIEQILIQAGLSTGVIGTLNYRFQGKAHTNPMTTPESMDLQRILAEMKDAGTTHVVMEVSSHGVDLLRIESLHFDAAVFTNLSQDHLDYHGTMENYRDCKKRFFTHYLNRGPKKNRSVAVINCDDDNGLELYDELAGKKMSTGTSSKNTVHPRSAQLKPDGIRTVLSTPKGDLELTSSLVGEYNLENILNATAAGLAVDMELKDIKKGIESVSTVPGRLERIADDRGIHVFIDYAHTPDALKNMLTALKGLAQKRIILVFGCGGDRDKTKRPRMGRIAVELSDLTVITSDNPRTEDPDEIINQIVDGINRSSCRFYQADELENDFKKKGYVVERDRKKAIALGISVCLPDDVVVIAGKGNETYQIIGDQTVFFDDRLEAEKAIMSFNR